MFLRSVILAKHCVVQGNILTATAVLVTATTVPVRLSMVRENRTAHNSDCQMISCDAGFYEKTSDANLKGKCTQVELNSGYYSVTGDKSTTACTGKPTQHAGWTNPAGSDESSDCTWFCDSDYTHNDGICYANTKVCDIENSKGTKIGTGTHSYQANTAGTYGTCGGPPAVKAPTHSIANSAISKVGLVFQGN